MLSLQIQPQPSLILVMKTWLADNLSSFLTNIKKGLVGDIINDFDRLKKVFEERLCDSHLLSKEQVLIELDTFQKVLTNFDALDKRVSHIPSRELQTSYKAFKKAAFKYEARLSFISKSELPVIKTDEALQIHLTNLGFASISNS